MIRFLLSLIIGLIIGTLLGLYLGWVQFPVEFVNSHISQLDPHREDIRGCDGFKRMMTRWSVNGCACWRRQVPNTFSAGERLSLTSGHQRH